MHPKIIIRIAVPKDTVLVLRFIQELAEYEHLSESVFMTEEILYEWISSHWVEVLLAEFQGETVGFALYYFTYSTFRGQPGIYIEDLFVRPQFRNLGIGTSFFRELARIAQSRGCFRLDWMVLDWNSNSIAFYKKLGAYPVEDWTTFRLDGKALEHLADSAASELSSKRQ
ncbi:MAG: GNAT family N-acetyltransferase [Planctomycetaceae bacterium]|jgi:GNAT superfamily N-acetyltransferase|nr:GNAT family N-acetyltransferase [Planctomycetaceae bacterium]